MQIRLIVFAVEMTRVLSILRLTYSLQKSQSLVQIISKASPPLLSIAFN